MRTFLLFLSCLPPSYSRLYSDLKQLETTPLVRCTLSRHESFAAFLSQFVGKGSKASIGNFSIFRLRGAGLAAEHQSKEDLNFRQQTRQKGMTVAVHTPYNMREQHKLESEKKPLREIVNPLLHQINPYHNWTSPLDAAMVIDSYNSGALSRGAKGDVHVRKAPAVAVEGLRSPPAMINECIQIHNPQLSHSVQEPTFEAPHAQRPCTAQRNGYESPSGGPKSRPGAAAPVAPPRREPPLYPRGPPAVAPASVRPRPPTVRRRARGGREPRDGAL